MILTMCPECGAHALGFKKLPNGDGQYTCYNCGWFDSSPEYEDREGNQEKEDGS
jgi:rubredoxin